MRNQPKKGGRGRGREGLEEGGYLVLVTNKLFSLHLPVLILP